MRNIFLILLAFLLVSTSIAQKHDSNWLMGGTCQESEEHLLAKLDFSSEDIAPELLPHIRFFFNNTNSSISDEEGNLLFYTNGNDVFSWNNILMENGANLAGEGECDEQNLQQGAISIPFPDHKGQYVLITINEEFILHGGDIQVFERVYFNVVDMAQNEGAGSLVARQELIVADTINTGQGTVCQHANGRDWWLLLFEYDSDKYYRYLVDPEGIKSFDQDSVGKPILAGRNQAVYSPDGEHFASFNTIDKAKGTYIDIFDFNRCEGELNNHLQIRFNDMTNFGSGGVAFSPNSRFLYVPNEIMVYQYDLWAEDIEASRVTVAEYDGFIEDDFWTSTFHMAQLAPNDKIYITTPTDGHYLHVIHNPNEKGLACNLEQHALEWPTWKHISIPNFPHYRMGPLEGSLCDTLGMATSPFANFVMERLGTSMGYQFEDRSTTNLVDWLWDFGEGSISAEQNPMHEYSQYGSYTICLTVSNETGENTQCQDLCVLPDAGLTSFISASSLELDCSDSQSVVTLTSRLAELDFYEASTWIAKWEGPDNFMVENSMAIEVSEEGIYMLTLTDANNACILTDTVSITENNANIVFELDPPLAILPCGGNVGVQIDIEGLGCTIVTVTDLGLNQFFGTDTTIFNFTSAGTYFFSVTDCEGGCETTQTLLVELDTISAVWEADIMENTVSFRSLQEDQTIQNHLWEFGDGNISFDAEPIHTYETVGSYVVEHTVFSFCENRSYKSEIVIVDGVFNAPDANFTFINTDSVFSFIFEDQTVNDPNEWLWDFGNGNTSTDQNPTHEYNQYGSYEVCLTATNNIGSDTYCETICVLPNALSADLIQASSTVLDCTNAEEGIVLSTLIDLSEFYNSEDWIFAWTYPTGVVSGMEEVLINEAGTHVFELIDTTSICSILSSIDISENFDTPTFLVSMDRDTIPCGSSFELYLDVDTTCFEVVVYQDEISILSSTQDTLVLEGAGNYTVELIDCTSGCSSTQEINIQNESITAAWTAEEMEATISFIPSQTTSVDHFWGFGDEVSSEEENPMHTYTSSGIYEVTHIVSNACGADTLVQPLEIIISSSYSIKESGIEVFPNPASDLLNITSEEKDITACKLYTSLGQLVVDEELQTKAMQLSVHDFTPGVYWLYVVLSDGDVYLEKVLVME